MNARIIYLAAIALLSASLAAFGLRTQAYDPSEYSYESFQYSGYSSDRIQLFLDCPDGYQDRSAEDAATMAYEAYISGKKRAQDIRNSGEQVTSDTIARTGRSSDELERYITEDLKCLARFEFRTE